MLKYVIFTSNKIKQYNCLSDRFVKTKQVTNVTYLTEC